MVLVLAAIGVSGSGKTTTLEYLISRFTKEDYKVGAIKHIHRENFTIDKEGSNTWRFSKAGSKITVAISPEEVAIVKKTSSSLDGLDQIIDFLEREQLDIVFIEGFHTAISKRADILKVVTAKNNEDLKKTLDETVQPILAIAGLIAKNKSNTSERGIPFIDLPKEGERLFIFIKKQMKATNV